MEIMRPEMTALADIIRFIRRREGRDADRIVLLADVEHPDQFQSVFLMIEHRLIEDDQEVPIGQGRQLCVPPPNGGDQLRCVISFGAARSATSSITRPASRQAP